MHNPRLVGDMHGSGQRFDHLGRLLGRQRRAVQFVGQAAAGAELQREVGMAFVLADLVNLHDVRVLQPGDRLTLGAEAGQFLGPGVLPGQDHLERDQTFERNLPGLVDDSHAAAGDLLQQLVIADVTDGSQRAGAVAVPHAQGVLAGQGGNLPLARKEGAQLGRQVRVALEPDFLLRTLTRLNGLEVSGDDFIEAAFVFGR